MFTALTLLLIAATPEDVADRGYVEVRRTSALRFGLSGAFWLGPRSFGSDAIVGAVELAALMERLSEHTSFRFGAALRVGGTSWGDPTLGVTGVLQFLVFPASNFGLGLAFEGGAIWVFSNQAASWLIAPGITLGSLRFGARHQHDLSLTASLVVVNYWSPGGNAIVRYTFFL